MLEEILKTLTSKQGDELPSLGDGETAIDREFGIKFGEEFGIKFGIKFGINDKQLLFLLYANPTLSASEIAEKTGLSQRRVEKQLKRLKELGVISRHGSRKTGQWMINK
jgi:DNA-binding MarR family transcriptional regulator